MKINTIPVFYHIPKNSGTYVFHCFLNEARKLNQNKTRIIRVLSESKSDIAKFIAFDDLNFLNQCDKFTPLNDDKIIWNLSIDDLTEDILQKLSIHSVFIKSRGFRLTDTLLKPLFAVLNKSNLYKFIILRDPFSREQSLYHYLTSEKSRYELTHGVFKSCNFEEHVMSSQLQDSWLIRNSLDIPPRGRELTKEDFDKACEFLKSLNIYDSKDTEKAIKKILLECFNSDSFDKEALANKKNENTYKKIKFEELSAEAQAKFKERKYWDLRIHEHFLGKNETSTLEK